MLKRFVPGILVCLSLVGCTATLTGGGELSIGMRNDNFLVLKHAVDGDKAGKEAKSQLEIDKGILDLVFPNEDESESSTVNPTTGSE